MMKTTALCLILCFTGPAGLVYGQEATTWVHSDDKRIVIKNHSGFTSFDIEVRGRIEVSDDDKDIVSMSPDGYLQVRKTVFGSKRTLIIASEEGGLRKEYYEGRTKLPFDPAGKQWMGEILPELVRSTTIGAESRVARFFKKGGTNAVLNEIDLLTSNHVKSKYASLLLKQPINPKEYAKIIDRMSETMDSNFYLAGFLKDNLDKFIKSNEALEAAFRATNNMDSDHYKTEVIKSGLSEKDVSIDAVKIIMKSTGNMDSDHYKTEVLNSLLAQHNLTDEVINEMIITTKTIDSDYYRSVVLNRALEKEGLSEASYQSALESVRSIDSDHYKAEVLRSLVSKPLAQNAQITMIDLTNSIDSDHYCTVVLEEILDRQEMDKIVFDHLLTRAANIESDHYASVVMKDALSRNLNEANLISLLKAAENIESDHYLTEVLVTAAPQVKKSGNPVKDAYRKAASQIESETYYGRALRALEAN